MSNKGYIVTNIPINCYECCCHNYHECCWTGSNIEDYFDVEERPVNCPINDFPYEEDGSDCFDAFEDGYAYGWNRCREEFLEGERRWLNIKRNQ